MTPEIQRPNAPAAGTKRQSASPAQVVRDTSLALETEVRFLRGVGPARAAAFEQIGVRTVGDLVEYFPFRHELRPRSIPIGEITEGQTVTLVGEVRRIRQGRGSGPSLSATLVDGTGRVRVSWFNSPYLADRIHEGSVVRITGKIVVSGEATSLTNPIVEVIQDDDDPFSGDRDSYVPVYSGTAQLQSRQIASFACSALSAVTEQIAEILPENLRVRRQLPPRRTAVLRYHQPTSPHDVDVARGRLAYEELLLCQLAVLRARARAEDGPKAMPIDVTIEMDRRIRKRFPFNLTPGQDRSIAEITADLGRSAPMNRLLQADVGAGKTAVALYAALAAVANRRQVAFIAPTEILASQHFEKTRGYLSGSRVRMALLSGAVSPRARPALLQSVRAGEVDLVIGTHALLDDDVQFRRLGLVIVDEQHKFGVSQRAALRRKGRSPHVLVLTATPIPRTLAMTYFGDLDVSKIEGLPPGRQPVVTRIVTRGEAEDAWAFVRSRLKRGEQAYVVYPLVEESDALPLKAVQIDAKALAAGPLKGYTLEVLHGRLKAEEKGEVMERFRLGKSQVLLATTVVEVGVDVPNATLMIVQHSERYGLSQLHQLRGRIGRGMAKSHCLLFHEGIGDGARERLEILCRSTDGFRIAEEDLRLRGPGELLGTRQHGLPEFRVADLSRDLPLLEKAREDAAGLLAGDATLSRPEHTALRREVIRRFGRALALVDVG